MSSRFQAARALLALAIVAGLAGAAFAQGTQTATLSGTVSSQDGLRLPGVVVTVSSPALQGERSIVTDANGTYIARLLPTGPYTVTFSLSGFKTYERRVDLDLGATVDVSPTLVVAGVEETVTVTGVTSTQLETTVVGTNFKYEAVDKLATGRTIQAIASLSPNVTENTPNAGQLTISGGFAYDNVFLLNGVDVNDNLFGTANNLFIEDAIEEVQTLTNGISAEFGRFSGGVINAVTKRGGNDFRGTFRVDFTNPSWTEETPYEKENKITRSDIISKFWSATLGGPIVRNRLWFFVAGRTTESTQSNTFPQTGIKYDQGQGNDRYEVKLTGSITTNHTVTGTYTNNKTEDIDRPAFAFSIDPRVLNTRQLPNEFWVLDYNGVLSSNVVVEGRYSEKRFGFRNSGGTETGIIDSPFLARGVSGIPANSHYNAPYFDSSDPENRNNRQFAGALSYFLSTNSTGRHDIKFGVEHFTTTRTGGNSQSATGYVFLVDPVVVGGQVQSEANGRIIPNFVPGVSRLQNWLPTRGAQIDIRTLSFYLNDRWALNDNWSFNLGVRYEDVKSEATSVSLPPQSSAFVPRLGLTWDIRGDGKHRVYATYAHYAGKAAETQFADNSPVGTPSLLLGQYTGPAGSGLGFAPGFDPANYAVIGGNFPLQNVFFGDDIRTPLSKEWTLGYGIRLGTKGDLKAVYTQRSLGNFLDDFITIDNGKTNVTYEGRNFGTFDNVVIQNTDGPERDYKAIQMQGGYRITDRWVAYANWTMQIENDGNFEGEATNQPGNYSIFGDYPEMLGLDRINPVGRINDFQRHKVRAWSSYDLGLGKFGTAAFGLLYRMDTPQTYSLSAAAVPISAAQRSRDPGYARPPTAQTLFFDERGSESYGKTIHVIDLSLNYEVPVYKSLRPWVKLELRNALNNDTPYFYNTSITAVTTGPVDADGLPTTYTKGANFGKATRVEDFFVQRTFLFSVGFRF
jgi:outer membrane receptor protein involved in Fe transport